jgi:hypothetical protein
MTEGIWMGKMDKVKLLLTVCVVLFFLTGCGVNRQYKALDKVCVLNLEKAEAMKAGEAVLNKMYFVIDKADSGQGVIRTRPLAGAQWFEFWRKDNVGSFNSAEANLQSIRRTAELNISRQEGQLCISCEVKAQRFSLPEREFRSGERLYGAFSKSGRSLQTLRLNSEQKKQAAWIDLGRDSRLETKILESIEKQIAKK